jgi:anti-anti-sigma factor
MSKASCRANPFGGSATVVGESRLNDVSVLHLEGPLYAVLGAELQHKVQALLNRGERKILLSLSGVSDVDAAGLGELIRAYNMTMAANAVLRITQVTSRVREVLERVRLLELLTEDSEPEPDFEQYA